MKFALKVFFASIGAIAIIVLATLIYALAITSGYKLNSDKLIGNGSVVVFCDAKGNEIDTCTSGKVKVEINEIPDYVKNAFIAVEDKRFYKHHGIDAKAMLRATLNNIKSFSFKEGGSTISQQLIKNTHLNNKKTLGRKFAEIKLTKKLEKQYSKNQILEMYLNTIYFGENSYGISAACETYFAKKPNELTIDEAAVLAGLIKAPSVYSPVKNAEKCKARRNTVLRLMREQGYIDENEYTINSAKPITISNEARDNSLDFYMRRAKAEFNEIADFAPYSITNCKVYTYLDAEKQNFLGELAKDEDCMFTAILIDNFSHGISAYFSNTSDDKRQVGSVIKPLAVYGPAIEENQISECTPILDEKTDFNGYAPSNYGDKYYGYISVRESLENSSNVCAVKILNCLTPEKSSEYLKKMNLSIEQEDKNLALALGATRNGMTLKDITSAYSVFSNDGIYTESRIISKIEVDGKTYYTNNPEKRKVFSEDTCDIMNYMLESVAKNGTARKLGTLGMNIAAKTGTVGCENGNSDAYSISFNQEFTLGVRFSGDLDNSITGGGLPTAKAQTFWSEFGSASPLNKHNGTRIVKLDRISYEKDNKLVIADENTPERYTIEGYFRNSNLPKEVSSRFTHPKTELPVLSINNNKIKIQLCQEEYIDYLIYKECDGNKALVFDSKGKKCKYEYDDEITGVGKLYEYFVVPYTDINGKQFKGEQVSLGKIKCTGEDYGDWWLD